jgi:hypothetical protein
MFDSFQSAQTELFIAHLIAETLKYDQRLLSDWITIIVWITQDRWPIQETEQHTINDYLMMVPPHSNGHKQN